MKRFAWMVPTLYIILLMLPIYWLVNMSFKTTNEILGTFTLWPQNFTFDNYIKIFTDRTWYQGYINSLSYVFMNTAMVSGLMPVVGIPLPLISYGGSVMLSIMISIGLILNVELNHNVKKIDNA